MHWGEKALHRHSIFNDLDISYMYSSSNIVSNAVSYNMLYEYYVCSSSEICICSEAAVVTSEKFSYRNFIFQGEWYEMANIVVGVEVFQVSSNTYFLIQSSSENKCLHKENLRK